MSNDETVRPLCPFPAAVSQRTTSSDPEATLNAPDLQLDCLDSDSDDNDDDNDDNDNEESNSVPQREEETGGVNEYPSSTSSSATPPPVISTRNPSTDSRISRIPRVRSASTSDSLSVSSPHRHNRLTQSRLMSHRHPFGSSSSSSGGGQQGRTMYTPHALLLRRQQMHRELNRTRSFLARSAAEQELLLFHPGYRSSTFGSHFNRILNLVGMRGVMGLQPEEIAEHTSTGKFESTGDLPEDDVDREKCTICLANYEEEAEIRTLGCRHFFHTNCVDTWLHSNQNCPMCRVPVVPPRVASSSNLRVLRERPRDGAVVSLELIVDEPSTAAAAENQE